MFPPVADRAKCNGLEHLTCSGAEQVSTCSPPAQVATSFLNGTKSEPLNGVAETPFPDAAPAADGGLYIRVDITPEELFQALGRLRSEAEAEIERLLTFLDELDADADFEGSADDEPTGDEREPDLGSVAGKKGFDQSTWSAGDDMVDGGEPSLGAFESHPTRADYSWNDKPYRTSEGSQDGWSTGNGDDREHCSDREEDDSHDGREPDDGDEEPSLGWTPQEAARGRMYAGSMGSPDLEESCEDEGVLDSGIADRDGYMEQWPELFARNDVRVVVA